METAMMIQGHIEPEGDAWQAQVQIVKEPASAMRVGCNWP